MNDVERPPRPRQRLDVHCSCSASVGIFLLSIFWVVLRGLCHCHCGDATSARCDRDNDRAEVRPGNSECPSMCACLQFESLLIRMIIRIIVIEEKEKTSKTLLFIAARGGWKYALAVRPPNPLLDFCWSGWLAGLFLSRPGSPFPRSKVQGCAAWH
jgi:hypothetical protein